MGGFRRSGRKPGEVLRRPHLGEDDVEDSADLSEVQAIVAGDHPEAQVVALRAPLVMNPNSSTLLRTAPVPQGDVGFSQRLEEVDQVLDGVTLVMEVFDPEVLVVPDQGWLVLGEYPAVPTAHRDLGVSEVCDHLTHGPFARPGLLIYLVACFLCKLPQLGGSRLLRRRGVVGPEQVEKELLVGSGFGHRIRGNVTVVHHRNLPGGQRSFKAPFELRFVEQCRPMPETLRGTTFGLVVLLIVEGLGALFVTLLNVITSRALGQDFLPWESSLIPGTFGVMCLAAALGVMRGQSWGAVLAAVAQVIVLAGGVIGLIYSGQAVLWVAAGLGLLGLIFVSRTVRRA